MNADYFKKLSLVGFTSGGFSPDGAVISEASSISRGIKVGGLDRSQLPGNRASLAASGYRHRRYERTQLLSFRRERRRRTLSWPMSVFVDLAKFHVMHFGSPVASSIHILLDRSLFPPDPARTALRVATLGRSIERTFPGALKVQDELSAVLKTAQADSLSAKILFIFLGFPGVVLAAYLASFSSRPFAAGRKRELGLLRTRGAGFSTILGITALNSLFLAIAASINGNRVQSPSLDGDIAPRDAFGESLRGRLQLGWLRGIDARGLLCRLSFRFFLRFSARDHHGTQGAV